MPFPYKILNEPTTGKTAPAGRKFIYVLMFNIDGKTHKPFYVGQTRSLTARFADHQMVTWHAAKFGRPALIWIAGQVKERLADQAEQSLIGSLLRANYRLTNTAIARANRQRQSARAKLSFQHEDTPVILRYLDQPVTGTPVLRTWQAHWEADEGYEMPAAGNELQPAEVMDHIRALDYRSPEGRGLSGLIAAAFDPGWQRSDIDLLTAAKGTWGPKTVHRAGLEIRHIWVFRRGFTAGTVKGFRLTKNQTAAVLAARRT